jgi:hypothetical protein
MLHARVIQLPPSAVGLCTLTTQAMKAHLWGGKLHSHSLLCMSARVTATKFENLSLGIFSSKGSQDLQYNEGSFGHLTLHVSSSNLVLAKNPLRKRLRIWAPLIWEVKASLEKHTWFGERRSNSYILLIHSCDISAKIVEQAVHLPKPNLTRNQSISCLASIFGSSFFTSQAILLLLGGPRKAEGENPTFLLRSFTSFTIMLLSRPLGFSMKTVQHFLPSFSMRCSCPSQT